MLYLLVLAVFIVVSILFWFVQSWLRQGLDRYQQEFKSQAHSVLSDMFLFLDPRQVWLASLALCAGVALLAYLFLGSVLAAFILSGVMLFTPSYALQRARRWRMQRLEQQLPDFLLALAGALRAGSGLQAGLRQVAAHVSAPLAQELGYMLREQRMGISFEQSLVNLHHRIPTDSFGLIVSALNVAARSGGGLSETLERMSVTLRNRLHLLGRVRALTSQGRMQAWVMAVLPGVLALVLYGLDPDAVSALWSTAAGWVVLTLIIVLETAGILVIRRIVRIDV